MYKNILFIILWLLIINLYSTKSFYENYLWENLYDVKAYSWSILKFEKSWNIDWVYYKANSLYKQKKYGEGIKEYKSILSAKNNELNFRLNHNIWNSFYRIWQSNKDTEIKIKNWQESVNFYTDALNIKYDEKTKQNLEFVLKKIKETKSKEQNKDSKENKDKSKNSSSQNNQENTWSWVSQKNSSSETWSWKTDNKSNQEKTWSWTNQKNSLSKFWSWNTDKTSWQKDDENKLNKSWSWVSKKDNSSKTWSWTSQKNSWEDKLSEEQNKALKQYEKALSEEQKNNADSFNKVYKENKTNDAFDNFFNDPFFNNDLLNNTNEKKDW